MSPAQFLTTFGTQRSALQQERALRIVTMDVAIQAFPADIVVQQASDPAALVAALQTLDAAQNAVLETLHATEILYARIQLDPAARDSIEQRHAEMDNHRGLREQAWIALTEAFGRSATPSAIVNLVSAYLIASHSLMASYATIIDGVYAQVLATMAEVPADAPPDAAGPGPGSIGAVPELPAPEPDPAPPVEQAPMESLGAPNPNAFAGLPSAYLIENNQEALARMSMSMALFPEMITRLREAENHYQIARAGHLTEAIAIADHKINALLFDIAMEIAAVQGLADRFYSTNEVIQPLLQRYGLAQTHPPVVHANEVARRYYVETDSADYDVMYYHSLLAEANTEFEIEMQSHIKIINAILALERATEIRVPIAGPAPEPGVGNDPGLDDDIPPLPPEARPQPAYPTLADATGAPVAPMSPMPPMPPLEPDDTVPDLLTESSESAAPPWTVPFDPDSRNIELPAEVLQVEMMEAPLEEGVPADGVVAAEIIGSMPAMAPP